MVPGCPPGLFTKQFAEFAPSSGERDQHLQQGHAPCRRPQRRPARSLPASGHRLDSPFNAVRRHRPRSTPHTFPYLVDKFFYTAAVAHRACHQRRLFGDPTGDGWFKMFEFFEVPSQMIGAVGPVAQGTNFDWLRQDTKPGLINLNLIIDEEVFFSVFGQQDQNFNQQLLNFYQLPLLRPFQGASMALSPGDVQRDSRDGSHVAAGRGVLASSHGGDRNHGQRIARRPPTR